MFDPRNNTTDQERVILRKLRVWIAALGLACLLAGIGIGAMLSGKPTIAQPDLQIARAPEALSASFAEIARRVEPAVVNIETTQTQPELGEKDEEKEDSNKSTRYVSSPATSGARSWQWLHCRFQGLRSYQPSRDRRRYADHSRSPVR